jgi:hypothetical protein
MRYNVETPRVVSKSSVLSLGFRHSEEVQVRSARQGGAGP